MPFKPLLFVDMPFGKKMDPTSQVEIDFDNIYETAIKAAALDADLDVIRADEEVSGGIIHLAMYERLLLAEIVVADLTLANPNVFYELGIRHAARPYATILMFAKVSGLPFDVAPLRAIPYTLDSGKLTDESRVALRATLTERLKAARESSLDDSPLFQLIEEYPGIALPHDATESFRDRANKVLSTKQAMDAIVHSDSADAEKQVRLGEVQASIGVESAPAELLVDLLLAYRGAQGLSQMIDLVALMPKQMQQAVPIRQQLAFALNRRNEGNDRREAQRVLLELVDEYGASPETCGILGRTYKDEYEEQLAAGRRARADGALAEAISWYAKGFDADPRDFYPGINLLTLLTRRGNAEDQARVKELYPVVSFAVARRGGMNASDYWGVATALELFVIGEDWPQASRAAARAVTLDSESWMVDSTVKNLGILRGSFEAQGKAVASIDEVTAVLEGRA